MRAQVRCRDEDRTVVEFKVAENELVPDDRLGIWSAGENA